jgi:hypothetical protein
MFTELYWIDGRGPDGWQYQRGHAAATGWKTK